MQRKKLPNSTSSTPITPSAPILEDSSLVVGSIAQINQSEGLVYRFFQLLEREKSILLDQLIKELTEFDKGTEFKMDRAFRNTVMDLKSINFNSEDPSELLKLPKVLKMIPQLQCFKNYKKPEAIKLEGMAPEEIALLRAKTSIFDIQKKLELDYKTLEKQTSQKILLQIKDEIQKFLKQKEALLNEKLEEFKKTMDPNILQESKDIFTANRDLVRERESLHFRQEILNKLEATIQHLNELEVNYNNITNFLAENSAYFAGFNINIPSIVDKTILENAGQNQSNDEISSILKNAKNKNINEATVTLFPREEKYRAITSVSQEEMNNLNKRYDLLKNLEKLKGKYKKEWDVLNKEKKSINKDNVKLPLILSGFAAEEYNVVNAKEEIQEKMNLLTSKVKSINIIQKEIIIGKPINNTYFMSDNGLMKSNPEYKKEASKAFKGFFSNSLSNFIKNIPILDAINQQVSETCFENNPQFDEGPNIRIALHSNGSAPSIGIVEQTEREEQPSAPPGDLVETYTNEIEVKPSVPSIEDVMRADESQVQLNASPEGSVQPVVSEVEAQPFKPLFKSAIEQEAFYFANPGFNGNVSSEYHGSILTDSTDNSNNMAPISNTGFVSHSNMTPTMYSNYSSTTSVLTEIANHSTAEPVFNNKLASNHSKRFELEQQLDSLLRKYEKDLKKSQKNSKDQIRISNKIEAVNFMKTEIATGNEINSRFFYNYLYAMYGHKNIFERTLGKANHLEKFVKKLPNLSAIHHLTPQPIRAYLDEARIKLLQGLDKLETKDTNISDIRNIIVSGRAFTKDDLLQHASDKKLRIFLGKLNNYNETPSIKEVDKLNEKYEIEEKAKQKALADDWEDIQKEEVQIDKKEEKTNNKAPNAASVSFIANSSQASDNKEKINTTRPSNYHSTRTKTPTLFGASAPTKNKEDKEVNDIYNLPSATNPLPKQKVKQDTVEDITPTPKKMIKPL